MTISRDEIRAAVAGHLDCAAADIADDTDLIALGLNSMRMMALAGGWRKSGSSITFADLAGRPTVAAWHGLLDAADPAAGPVVTPPAADAPPADPPLKDAPFPLAPMQHAYWIGRSAEQELGGVAAHLYVEFDGGAVDPVRLQVAVQRLVTLHPMLRTRFLPDGTQQTLPAPGRPVFAVVDLRGGDAETALAELRDRKTHQRLAIDDGQVLDVTLSLRDGGYTRLHLDVDMLAGDAMSYRTLVADLAQLYRGATVAPPGYTYRRYRTEHRQDDTVRERDRQWWHQRLAGLPGAPELPAAPADRRAGQRTVRYDHWLNPAAKQTLIAAAHARGLTPAVVLAAVFADTIGGWCAEQTFLLNVPLFHREPVHPDIDRVIGDFTSSLLLSVDLRADLSVTGRASALQRELYESGSHAGYSGLDVLRDLGRHRGEPVLAPVVFTSALDLGELFADDVLDTFGEPVWIVSQGPQVLLDAQVTEVRGGLLVNWDVRESAFPPGLVEVMFAAFTDAVDRLAGGCGWDDPAAVALPAGQAAMRAAVNATDGPVSERPLHRGFFDHAAAQPDSPALLWDGGQCGYGELAADALAVAGALHAAGVRPGDSVAIQLPKGPDQIPAVLGVLAAGAGYVPIGVDQPAARREKILATAGVSVVLGSGGLDLAAARRHPPLAAPVYGSMDDIAYVMFTSGSTGEPKGVEVSHRAAMNTIDAINEEFAVSGADRTLALSALEFDLSVYDVFGMLSAGGAVVTVDAAQRAAPTAWMESMRRHRVSVLNCVPSMLDMILQIGDPGDTLRAVLLGGDWVSADLARRLGKQVPGCRLAGLGGATETAIHSTICEVDGAPPPDWVTVPYGTPLRNVRCRVVAQSGRDCPDWVPGELWVGGAGVAAGYRNDPVRTAQRFVERDGLRWYRTGDLARYRPDGTLEFLGRADNQVQLRGYRVELGEVESALRAVPGVREAVAVVVGDRAPQLVAAVTGDVDDVDLAGAVATLLPGYMVPTRIAMLERMPLSPNAKLDRRAVAALLASEVDEPPDSRPSDELEAALAVITAEVLGVDSVGVHGDFFALGGDSVLATGVVARVRDWLDVDHAVVADLFATRTVAGLADRLRRREAERGTPDRLAAVAAIYLEIAAMTDDEVLAAGESGQPG